MRVYQCAVIICAIFCLGCEPDQTPATVEFDPSNVKPIGTHASCRIRLPAINETKSFFVQIRRTFYDRDPEVSVVYPIGLEGDIPPATDGNFISTSSFIVESHERAARINLSLIDLNDFGYPHASELIGGELELGAQATKLQSKPDFLIGKLGSWAPLSDVEWRDNEICLLMMRRSTENQIIDYHVVAMLTEYR